jgi:hypothetical protein
VFKAISEAAVIYSAFKEYFLEAHETLAVLGLEVLPEKYFLPSV